MPNSPLFLTRTNTPSIVSPCKPGNRSMACRFTTMERCLDEKLQAPSSNIQRITNHQTPKAFATWVWCLEIGASLAFAEPEGLVHTPGQCSGATARCELGKCFGPAGWSLDVGAWSLVLASGQPKESFDAGRLSLDNPGRVSHCELASG